MTILEASPYPDDHPFSMYLYNLHNRISESWFSRTASVNVLRDYLWSLMRLRHENVRHTLEGFAWTSAGTVLFIAASNSVGSIITCFPFNEIGTERVQQAMQDEDSLVEAELARGTYVGNLADAHRALTSNAEDRVGSGVFAFVNGSTISPLNI